MQKRNHIQASIASQIMLKDSIITDKIMLGIHWLLVSMGQIQYLWEWMNKWIFYVQQITSSKLNSRHIGNFLKH